MVLQVWAHQCGVRLQHNVHATTLNVLPAESQHANNNNLFLTQIITQLPLNLKVPSTVSLWMIWRKRKALSYMDCLKSDISDSLNDIKEIKRIREFLCINMCVEGEGRIWGESVSLLGVRDYGWIVIPEPHSLHVGTLSISLLNEQRNSTEITNFGSWQIFAILLGKSFLPWFLHFRCGLS